MNRSATPTTLDATSHAATAKAAAPVRRSRELGPGLIALAVGAVVLINVAWVVALVVFAWRLLSVI